MNSSHLPDYYMKQFENFIKKFESFMDVDKFWFKDRILDNYVRLGQYSIKPKPDDILITDIQGTQGYHILVPLMMNMVVACNTEELAEGIYAYKDPFLYSYSQTRGSTPFITQVYEYSLIAALYPYRVFPFIVFNPLIQASAAGKFHLDMCKNAIDNLGFVGIKLYPAHGYSPDPFDYLVNPSKKINIQGSELNNPDIYKEFNPVGQALIDLYSWVNEKKLPVTTHCQHYSMQKVVKKTDENLAHKNSPDKWENVLAHFSDIRINFAHFGGNEYSQKCINHNSLSCVVDSGKCSEIFTANPAKPCRKMIKDEERTFSLNSLIKIIKFANNPELNAKNRIFTDIASHYFNKNLFNWFGEKDQKRYVNHIKSIIDFQNNSAVDSKLKFMYGTDTPVPTLYNISDKKYLAGYTNILNPDFYKNFYWDNAVEFLFGSERKFPSSYIKFINNAGSEYCLQMDLSHLNKISSDGITID